MQVDGQFLRRVYFETLKEVAPDRIVGRWFEKEEIAFAPGQKVWLFGAGKASLSMGEAVCQALRQRAAERNGALNGALICGGLLISPEGAPYSLELSQVFQKFGVQVVRSSHPHPDESSVGAANALLEMAKKVEASDHVIFVLSGGASALLSSPVEGVSVFEKAELAKKLMSAGASIGELNLVRRHLSRIKGGKLQAHFKAPVTVLVFSDVPDNNLADIGSGPFALDTTTLEVAREVLQKRLGGGDDFKFFAPKFVETPKAPNSPAQKVHHAILADALTLAHTAVRVARKYFQGEIEFISKPVTSEVKELACQYQAMVARTLKSDGLPKLVIRFGEPVVKMSGEGGKGGRSQQLALELAGRLKGLEGWAFLAAGSDGRDGSSEAAGALVDGKTWRRVQQAGRDPELCLRLFDAYSAHDAAGTLIRSAQTGNNLLDLHLLTSISSI